MTSAMPSSAISLAASARRCAAPISPVATAERNLSSSCRTRRVKRPNRSPNGCASWWNRFPSRFQAAKGPLSVTASLGLATLIPGEDTADTLIRRPTGRSMRPKTPAVTAWLPRPPEPAVWRFAPRASSATPSRQVFRARITYILSRTCGEEGCGNARRRLISRDFLSLFASAAASLKRWRQSLFDSPPVEAGKRGTIAAVVAIAWDNEVRLSGGAGRV